MGYKPDIPTRGKEFVATERDLDQYQIIKATLMFDPMNTTAPYMIVHWVEGYKDRGTFVPVVPHETSISQVILQPLLDAKGSSKSLDKLLCGLIWDALLGVNAVGAGTKE